MWAARERRLALWVAEYDDIFDGAFGLALLSFFPLPSIVARRSRLVPLLDVTYSVPMSFLSIAKSWV